MVSGQIGQIEHIFQHMSVGIAILDCANLRFRHVNSYLLMLLDQPRNPNELIGRHFTEVLPEDLGRMALPYLRQACTTGERMSWSDVPYDGALATRGRTYCRVAVERIDHAIEEQLPGDAPQTTRALLITIEDTTESVRSQLYVNAIHHISTAIAEPFALPQVLDRILKAVQEMVGATRCAILLIDHSVSDIGLRFPGFDEQPLTKSVTPPDTPPTVTIAAQVGVHLRSQDWHPQLSEQILLGQAVRERRTLIITDTAQDPELILPLLDDDGTPRRPGSALCIPIFNPTTENRPAHFKYLERQGSRQQSTSVLGAIEVYHRRTRGFPAEEVALLEQFAQQAGLAIQNARMFLDLNRLARDANRNLRQRDHVMQAIPDGVIIYDFRWRVADANYAIRKLFGWSNDVIGLDYREALTRCKATFPDDLKLVPDQVPDLDRRALQRHVDEFKMVGADGQRYTMRRSYAPIHDTLGDIFAYAIVYHDVTEQAAARERIEAEVVARTAELALRNEALSLAKAARDLASARMELLLERLPSGAMLVSTDNKHISIINRQAVQLLQLLGLPLNPLDDLDAATTKAIGRNIEKLLRNTPVIYGSSGSSVPYEEQPFALALYQGEASEAELHTSLPSGDQLFLLVSAAPLRAGDGAITNIVLVLHDITKLKMLERAREDFFTTMAHELKTPLANIRAHLSALQVNDLHWSRKKQLDFLESADEQVERLVRMINHVLDASRVEAGALRLGLEPILLPEMLEDLEERLEALIISSGRRLEISIPPHVPTVIADYELIMNVLTNLLSNAFRYAPEGDIVQLEVTTIYSHAENETNNGERNHPMGVELRVTDRGPGMSAEQQAGLFTRFSTFAAMSRPSVDRPGQPTEERRRGSSRWSPATGLGLYISKGFVEAHGSHLSLKSSPGEGASFAFILPVAKP